MIEAIRFELHDTVSAFNGDDLLHAKFGSLLNHPIHFLTFEQ